MNAISLGFKNGMKITLTEQDVAGDSITLSFSGVMTRDKKMDLAERLESIYFGMQLPMEEVNQDIVSVIMWSYYSEHESGDAFATYNLGRIFYYGLIGQPRNQELGKSMLKEAAKANSIEAQDLLRLMWETW